ncbi:MAG: ribonuclease P subunit p25 family protein [Nitrosopumilaceae archaeon]|jgi:DNA-binding protein
MLTEETKGPNGQEQTKESETVFEIHNDPVMQSALDALSIIGKYKEITIKARGNSIPNAVAVANILTENMLKGNSKIKKILVDSEPIHEMGRTQSNIEIIIQKI